MKVSHSTRTTILQLVDPACAAAQEQVETRIWNFHFLSVFSAKLRLGRISAGHGTDIPGTTHLGLPYLCTKKSKSSANRYEIDK